MAVSLPLIAALVGIGSGGVAAGSAIYNDVSKPATPTPTAGASTLPQANTLTPNQISQASQQAGTAGANTQANTAQGLAPGARASLLDQLYGTPG